MLKFLLVFFIVQLFNIEYRVLAESRTNFKLLKVHKCPSDGSLEYNYNLTKENNNYYVDLDFKFPIPLDSNVGMIWSIETSLDGHNFLPLFTIREKDFCKACNKYLGEFWYDMERAVQIPPGICPVAAGRYRTHHHLLDFHRISLQTFPFGTLRFKLQTLNKRTKKIMSCTMSETMNLEN